MRPSATQINAVYQRLLAHEPDAPNDFIELLLDPLIERFRLQYPQPAYTDLISDVVIDTLLTFVQQPDRYHPTRGELWNYLCLDVSGDLRNSRAKEVRRQSKEVVFNLVAHDLPDGNINIEEEVMQRIENTSSLNIQQRQHMLSQLRAEFPDPRDWQILLLMSSGERRTSAFAALLHIEHLPMNEQRALVKKSKDRLRLRLKRYGVKFHEH